MKPRWLVAIVWLAFVLRGVYYSVQLPMWEGLDEWAHFAVVQYFAEHGHMPARTDLVSDEVVRSLELTPLAWSNNGWVAGGVNHDQFWQLPAVEQGRRREELARLTAAYRRPAELPPAVQEQYEAQQPPLYYVVLAVPYLVSRNWSLPPQVLWLRVLSVLLASATIPFAYAIARRIPAARYSAAPVIAFLAAMPAVLLFAGHVANDALAVSLMTLALWGVLRAWGKTPAESRRQPRLAAPQTHLSWLFAGVALGLALLTKGYAIVLIPIFAAAALRNLGSGLSLANARGSDQSHDRKGVVSVTAPVAGLAVALLIAGWWYAGNLTATGTLAGDQMEVAAHARLTDRLAAIPRIDWLRVLDSAAMTHIWIGGWSFLQLRSWMYRVWELIALVGLAGVILIGRRIAAPLIAAQALFVIAMAWFSVNAYLALHITAGVGWYLIAMCAAEATLLACGFAGLLGLRRGRMAMAATAFLALALDLYTVHFMLLPYYTGLIRHRPNGAMEAFHPKGIPPGVPTIWPLYAIANAALAGVILWSIRNPRPAPAHRPKREFPSH